MVVRLWRSTDHPVFDIYEYEHDVEFERESVERFKQFINSSEDESTKTQKFCKLISHLYYMTIVSLTNLRDNKVISEDRTRLTVHKLTADVDTLQSILKNNRYKQAQDRKYLTIVLSRVLAINYTIAKVNKDVQASQIPHVVKSIIEE